MVTTITPVSRTDRVRLRQLAERVRRAVLDATLARDLATKVACWDEYRAARTEAVAMLAASGAEFDVD
ncbi:MAG: hypothetical protein ABSG81_16000 [Acidimicrobiales bacterium]|jgi:hypothetical protein